MVELIINIAMAIIYVLIMIPFGMFLSNLLGSFFNDYLYLSILFLLYFLICLVVSFVINTWVMKQINAATARFKEDKDIDKYLAELDRCEKLVRKKNRTIKYIAVNNAALAYSSLGDSKAAKTLMLNIDFKVPHSWDCVYRINMSTYSFLLDEDVEAIEYYMTIDSKQLEKIRKRAKINIDTRCALAFLDINKFIYEGNFDEARALFDTVRDDMMKSKPERVEWLLEKISRYEEEKHEFEK